MNYVPTIGLEIHAELKTRAKMFCASKNEPNASRPNVNICPVCLAHPGTLPTINSEAILHVLRMGVAIGGTIADYTEFDRKNYFYPDLPKGYQISQYEHPLVSGGNLSGVAITRIHLEEDTARSQHDPKTGNTLVDYNRAGVPLMELVTDPVIHSAKQAGDFARELQLLLRYLGSGDANMEKGEMRVEANISVAKEGGPLGTKVEVKNLNSFRSVERAIEYEIKRQTDMLSKGETVVQETRGWDEAAQKTFAQRVKEGSADYRYFPDPDLPKLVLSAIKAFSRESIGDSMPELPSARLPRYIQIGIPENEAALYVREKALGDFLERVLEAGSFGDAATIRLSSSYLSTDVVSIVREKRETDTEYKEISSISPAHFAELISMIAKKTVSSRAAKDILKTMIRSGESPLQIAKREGLEQKSGDDYIKPIIQRVLEANTGVVETIRSGKTEAFQFLIGQVMKETKGAADPEAVKAMLLKMIELS